MRGDKGIGEGGGRGRVEGESGGEELRRVEDKREVGGEFEELQRHVTLSPWQPRIIYSPFLRSSWHSTYRHRNNHSHFVSNITLNKLRIMNIGAFPSSPTVATHRGQPTPPSHITATNLSRLLLRLDQKLGFASGHGDTSQHPPSSLERAKIAAVCIISPSYLLVHALTTTSTEPRIRARPPPHPRKRNRINPQPLPAPINPRQTESAKTSCP